MFVPCLLNGFDDVHKLHGACKRDNLESRNDEL